MPIEGLKKEPGSHHKAGRHEWCGKAPIGDETWEI